MKKYITTLAFIFAIAATLTSCREQTAEEKIIDEMEDAGATIEKEYGDDGKVEIKMETENKEVKIEKKDGKTEIKVESDDN